MGTTTREDPTSLVPYKNNPRRGDIGAIIDSLLKNSQYKPIVVNVGTHTGRPNEVLAGNHTLAAVLHLAAEKPGDPAWQSMAVHWVDVDEAMAARIVVADNRISELGYMDNAVLDQLFDQFDRDLTGTGYTADDLARMFPQDTPPDSFPDFGDDIATEHCCPKCGYEWSGCSSR